MMKPQTSGGYSANYTLDCERVLVTLMRGLGPWKESVFLIGGLVPRYLVRARPPAVPAHAGTSDVDVVIDLAILTDTQAYHTLEENFKKNGFERSVNEHGRKLSWRWQTRTEHGVLMVLELLADAPEICGGKVQALPTEGTISALNIPHSSMVFDHHEQVEICAELLGDNGLATEWVKYADVVSFTCLKSLAFDQRNERKDAHDLVYCIEHADLGLDAVVSALIQAQGGKFPHVIRQAFDILHRRFVGDDPTNGYKLDGPVSVAKFELGEDDEFKETRALRQREVSDLIEQLLMRVNQPGN